MKITVTEDGVRSSLEFDRDIVRIGRAVDNDIRLANTLASRHHCEIEASDEGASVRDLGSSNGTQVNGEKIESQLLAPGDVIMVGGTELRLHGLEPSGGASQSGSVDSGVALATQTGTGQRHQDNLKVFARITRALVSLTELQPLLRRIVDSAVTLVGGERGFLLLADRTGAGEAPSADALTVRVARQFDASDIPVPSSRLSMGIADRVIASGRPLLSIDAGRDDRFEGMASVEDLKLRSVLCLPIRIEDRTEGVLYVDNRLQRGAFSEDDLDLVELFAGQAAVAILNARLMAELRERNQRLTQSSTQIARLNEQLGRKIRDRDSELAVVRAELGRERGRYDYTSIVGASETMRNVFQQLDRVVESELPTLIQGESGTGKELIARAIHYNGPRKDKPFVVENCAALPDTLLESELFGHTKGAFTGADRAKKGLLEQADGGTLFLDEIGDMSAEMQKKLLRVLQDGEVRPLGSNTTVSVDVRLISASHQDLEAMTRDATFREDLFYRVNVLALQLPPLRDRREDVPLLAEALITRAAREAGRSAPSLPHEVQGALVDHSWPGNVRELENEMRRLVVLAEDQVTLEHLSPSILEGGGAGKGGESQEVPEVLGDLRGAVARFERRAIDAALQRAGGNKSQAAKELGISRFALQRKLDKYAPAEASSEAAEGQ